MRRCESVPLGSLLMDFLKAQYPEADEHLSELHVIQNWPQVVGPFIGNRTENLEIRDHILYVRLSSAPLRNELFNNRQVLVQRLNDSVSRVVITDIRFN